MLFWYECLIFILETSNSEQTGTSKDSADEITGLPSASNQSTQTEDVLDLPKEPAKEDVSKEQGSTLSCHSQNETEVWVFIVFLKHYIHIYFIKMWPLIHCHSC